MNSRTSEAIDTGYGLGAQRAGDSQDVRGDGQFILLSEVEDLIRDTTWLSGEELALEQPVFCLRRAAQREARDAVGRAFARHARSARVSNSN